MSQMDREEYEERTRPKLTGGSSPTAKNTLRVILLSMAVPIILSATGPLYYGYTDGPYWRVIVWALACTVGFSWLERSSFKSALSTARPSMIGRSCTKILMQKFLDYARPLSLFAKCSMSLSYFSRSAVASLSHFSTRSLRSYHSFTVGLSLEMSKLIGTPPTPS